MGAGGGSHLGYLEGQHEHVGDEEVHGAVYPVPQLRAPQRVRARHSQRMHVIRARARHVHGASCTSP
jgi:hypothetical protein